MVYNDCGCLILTKRTAEQVMKRLRAPLEHLLDSENPDASSSIGLDSLIMALPFKERCLLRLLYHRGAFWWEVAGALGMSIHSLRRRIRQTLKRAENPRYAAMLKAWPYLEAEERRLLYLYRMLGLSLREIARQGLAEGTGQVGLHEPGHTVSALRRRLTRVERKAVRLARQIHRRPPQPQGAAGVPVPGSDPRTSGQAAVNAPLNRPKGPRA